MIEKFHIKSLMTKIKSFFCHSDTSFLSIWVLNYSSWQCIIHRSMINLSEQIKLLKLFCAISWCQILTKSSSQYYHIFKITLITVRIHLSAMHLTNYFTAFRQTTFLMHCCWQIFYLKTIFTFIKSIMKKSNKFLSLSTSSWSHITMRNTVSFHLNSMSWYFYTYFTVTSYLILWIENCQISEWIHFKSLNTSAI